MEAPSLVPSDNKDSGPRAVRNLRAGLDRVSDSSMHVRLSKTFHFEAAHDLPTFPPDHKCRRLHGHSFRFDVIIEGDVDPQRGYLIDYGEMGEAARPIVKQLDHHYLNKIEGLSNPTSENLAKWIFDRLKPALPELTAIIVHETCTSSCEYRGSVR
jgi:6-pyruvoyltetrahydropterin/6-carboxytetrahydropterin synthase